MIQTITLADAYRMIDVEADRAADEIWGVLCASGIAEHQRHELMQQAYRALDQSRDRARARADALFARIETKH